MEFNPTQEQIEIAQLLFIARAYLATAEEEIKKMHQAVLNSGNYPYQDCWYGIKRTSDKYPADRIVRNPEHVFLMKGVELVDKPGYENTELCRFYEEVRKKALAAGYLHAENAASIADREVRDLENKLIDSTTNIHGKLHEYFTIMNVRTEIIKFLQNLFRHIVKKQDSKTLMIQYLNERLTDQAVTRLTTFTSSEASFKKFKALRDYIPIEDFLINLDIDNHLIELFIENVEGIYIYTPKFYLYKIKLGCSMQFPDCPPTTRQFVFIDHKNEINEGNNFPIIERELFYEFINQTT